jgi:hypothetical protein
MSFEGMPEAEKKESVTEEEAVEALRREGVGAEAFQKFMDQGEEEATWENSNAANLEWDLRRLRVYHRAGMNAEHEAEDLAVLRCAADSSGEEEIVEEIDRIIREGWDQG